MSNTFGRVFRITTFGESHGPSIGVVIDGCPAGIPISEAIIQAQLDRRRPGQSAITTQRKEKDKVQIESGVFEGYSTGTPIHLRLRNEDARSKDYSENKNTYRPSHADYTYQKKYGLRDYRGGGRSSARETACRVAAGAIAQQILSTQGIHVYSFVKQIHTLSYDSYQIGTVPYEQIDQSLVRCPDLTLSKQMEQRIQEVKQQGDSVGGIIECHILNVPAGLGEPIYDKLQARLAAAMLGINACKGFDYGSGFRSASMKGSKHNDAFIVEKGQVQTATNYSGGIQGGISNGMPIYFRAVFKPTSTVALPQKTVNTSLQEKELAAKGRHDPCVLPRAVPIVDAMTCMVLLDFILLQKLNTV